MDPNKLLIEIVEHVDACARDWSTMTAADRLEARTRYRNLCDSLHTWLRTGGFMPDPAPLIARAARESQKPRPSDGPGTICANQGFDARGYAFLAPIPHLLNNSEFPEHHVWRFAVYDARGNRIAEYWWPKQDTTNEPKF